MKILIIEKNKFFKFPIYEKSKIHLIVRGELINSTILYLSIVLAKTV